MKADRLIELEDIVEDLIESKKEGNYWDFKEVPHENNADLLHDILCLSNSICDNDRYLILGISDPSTGCQIVGLERNQKNRKKQSDLIDFLSKIRFADYQPDIEIHSITVHSKSIDVIQIKNEPLKPFYISENYKCKSKEVKAFHIYTRTRDVNTARDKSADKEIIEKMWKERFGLTETPMERFVKVLESPEDWNKNMGNQDYAFHNQFPEFRIEFIRTHDGFDPYLEFYDDNRGYFGKAYFQYHGKTLFELEYVFVDGGIKAIATPMFKSVNESKNGFWYYMKSDMSWTFLCFLLDNYFNFKTRGIYDIPLLIFSNKSEVEMFTNYLNENKEEIKKIQIKSLPFHADYKYTRALSLEYMCKSLIVYKEHKWREIKKQS